tara:strand:+ start:160 stop:507 length:348 start_codon:yes stop_codon:yes gene_type:complete
MKQIMFIAFFFLTSLSFAKDVPTVAEYKENRDNTKFDGYLYGLENGLDWASEYAFRKHDMSLFCKPKDIMLPSNEIKKMIDEELNMRDSFYSKYKDEPLIGLALRNSFARNFPCN